MKGGEDPRAGETDPESRKAAATGSGPRLLQSPGLSLSVKRSKQSGNLLQIRPPVAEGRVRLGWDDRMGPL